MTGPIMDSSGNLTWQQRWIPVHGRRCWFSRETAHQCLSKQSFSTPSVLLRQNRNLYHPCPCWAAEGFDEATWGGSSTHLPIAERHWLMLKDINVSLDALALIKWIKLNLVADDEPVMKTLAQSYPLGKWKYSEDPNHLSCKLVLCNVFSR